ncbi:DUF2259 domain-containing protein [Treponema sp.]|uniref:DUF2259 domain-containing protein n=1 Tax=Treponema sp. TaxID=166 RepID=UPI0025DF49AA|nr:DUF2259 domain-containing protein [Treponema sp.]MCR5217157.1 DUF2259 domain-containing protein [Treponema sp.]
MKRFLMIAAAAMISLTVYAGDAAVYEDLGFSEDGKTYIFAQYGKTDKDFQGWAEIYTVDVEKNNYVKNEVYKTNPKDLSKDASGKQAFNSLMNKTLWKRCKYNAKPANAAELLYLREAENKGPTDEIVFRNFDSGVEVIYKIKLIPEYEGKGKNVRSKYYINVTMTDKDGNTLNQWKVGTPDLKRKGITSYLIDRIFTSKDKKSLVIVVQKTLEDDKGTSIRYMVETLKF